MIEQQEEEQVYEPLPEFAEIQGQKIKLAGLDYSLLQRETQQQKKQKLMNQIKLKLQDYSHKTPVQRNASFTKITQDNDQLTKNIMNYAHTKPSITHSTFYLFPLQLQFSPHQPEVITRRFGRMHMFPLYVHHTEGQIEEFRKLNQRDELIKHYKRDQQRQAKKLVPQLQLDNDQDEYFYPSFSIFGEQSGDESSGKIVIGKKLQLGVNESEIFGGSRYKEVVKQVEQAPKVQDKYDFLHKKRKVNQDENGYDECYVNTGPSLQQMKQLRKEGIELFGDAKQYVQKEKKYNINKDYQKIKRIIEQKSKKA